MVETAYANTLDNLDQKTNAVTATEEAAGGYKASQDGQYEFLTDLVDKIKDVKITMDLVSSIGNHSGITAMSHGQHKQVCHSLLFQM